MTDFSNPQEIIKELKSIEVLIGFKTDIAKARLTDLIEALREIQKNGV